MSRERISKYRTVGGALGADAALRVAELLELDAGYVLACMEAERTDSTAAREIWEKAADRLKSGGVAAALLLLVAAPAPTPASAASIIDAGGLYIMTNARRWLKRLRSSLADRCRYSWLFHGTLHT